MNIECVNIISFPCCMVDVQSRSVCSVNKELSSMLSAIAGGKASGIKQLSDASEAIINRLGQNDTVTFSYDLVLEGQKKLIKIRCQYTDDSRRYIVVIFYSDLSNYIAAAELSLFAELVPSGLMLVKVTGDGRYFAEYVNTGLLDMLGYTRKECLEYFSNDVLKFIYPDDVEEGLRQYHRQIAETGSFNLTGRLICKGGELKVVSFTGKQIRGMNGDIRAYCSVTDITHTQQLLEETYEERQLYSVLESVSKHVLFKYELKSSTISFYGFSLKRFLDKSCAQFTRDQLLEWQRAQGGDTRALEALFSGLEQGVCDPKLVMIQNIENEPRWLEFKYDFVYDRDGNTVSAIGQVEDITQQINAKAYYDKAIALWSIDQNCDTQIALNLTTNTVVDGRSVLFSREKLPGLTSEQYFSKMLEAVVNNGEKKRLMAALQREALLECYKRNELRLQFEVEASVKCEHIWTRISIELLENPASGSIIALIKWTNINDVKLQRAINRLLISDIYDFTCCIFTKTDSYIMVENPENNRILPSSVSCGYEKFMNGCIAKYSGDDDKEYLKFCFSIKNLTERLKSSARYSFIGHGAYPDGTPTIKSHEFTYLDKSRGIILYSRRDITNQGNLLSFKSEGNRCNLEFSEIKFIESFGRKCELTTAKGVLTANESISSIQNKLPGKLFMRCHRSYIISLSAVEYVQKNAVQLSGGVSIPVNRQSLALLKARFN